MLGAILSLTNLICPLTVPALSEFGRRLRIATMGWHRISTTRAFESAVPRKEGMPLKHLVIGAKSKAAG